MTEPSVPVAEVLAANDAFYAAFAAGDLAAMDRVWAADNPVSCLHPGWPIMLGRQRVMASWQMILSNPPAIRHEDAQVLTYDRLALVVCREIIGNSVLTASNLFVPEGTTWRMAHHQACPAGARDTESDAGRPPHAVH